MALIKFFKVPKHRKYDYSPRYWKPEQEELHDRIRRLETSKAQGIEGMRDRVKSGLQRTYTRDNSARKMQTLRSNLRLLAIIGVLLALTYIFLTQYLPQILEMVEGKENL